MAKLIWNEVGKRFYETGVRMGVLYLKEIDGTYPLGVAWNGLTAVTESPSGSEPNPIYANNAKYLNMLSKEEFGATIEAYTYPDEFGECDGSAEIVEGVKVKQQKRKEFGLAYRTVLGNDVSGNDHGYMLHIIYGALATPSEKAYQSLNDSPEVLTFSWEVTTTPVPISLGRPTAHITINSTKMDPIKLEKLEAVLYGTSDTDPYLPSPEEVLELILFVAGYSITELIAGVSSEFKIDPMIPSLEMSRYAIFADDELISGKIPVTQAFRTVPIMFESDRISIAFYDERTYNNPGVEPTVITTLKKQTESGNNSTGILILPT